jgi:hypothetical protein
MTKLVHRYLMDKIPMTNVKLTYYFLRLDFVI